MKLVKGVEEAFLRLFFAGDELDIVNQKNVSVTITISELVRRSFFQAAYKLVGKALSSGVQDLIVVFSRQVTGRLD